jgi:hypothetical protein
MPWTYDPASTPGPSESAAEALLVLVGATACISGLNLSLEAFVRVDRRPTSLSRSSFSSWSFQATAFRSRIRLASLTRRRNRGSVANVRNVSFRIFPYAGEAPRWISDR